MKSKRTIATSIPLSVKKNVWERDNHCCIFCGRPLPLTMANMHFISRASGGLGIEENIGTGCGVCHSKMDQSLHRKPMLEQFERYLRRHYKDWNKDDLIYRKGE